MSHFFASKESYQKMINDVFTVSDAEFEALFKATWSPDLEVTIDGKPMNYEAFHSSVKHFRSSIVSSKLTVTYLLREGNTFAEKHTAEGLMKDGKSSKVEAYCFGELDAQGRIRKMDEAIIVRGDWAHPIKKSEDE